jgi:hypothetical protein
MLAWSRARADVRPTWRGVRADLMLAWSRARADVRPTWRGVRADLMLAWSRARADVGRQHGMESGQMSDCQHGVGCQGGCN